MADAGSDATQQTAVHDMSASQMSQSTLSNEPAAAPVRVTVDAKRGKKNKRNNTNLSHEMSEYFVGPRDTRKHSKWPTFMRMHGSILPEMILPMLFVSAWAVTITCISKLVHPLGVSEILLTILGFVVGLGLSFRSSSAYERYCDGRKYWTQLMMHAQTMGRTIWQHTREREGELGKQDLLAKLSALNLIWAFSIALKHRLRFEPYQHYEDLEPLIGYLDTFARAAESPETLSEKKKNNFKRTGEYLGVPFAESNPRKLLKTARKPLGNLPLEILSYLGAYVDSIVDNGTLTNGIHQSTLISGMSNMNEILCGTDRVLNTPLPVAYSIAISQMTWIYVAVLPFQLIDSLGWITIPGAIVGSYIILAMSLIGNEIENPFGNDVNDLPLDNFCELIGNELDVVAAAPRRNAANFITSEDNKVFYPLSLDGYRAWQTNTEEKIREVLFQKASFMSTPRKSSADDDGKQQEVV